MFQTTAESEYGQQHEAYGVLFLICIWVVLDLKAYSLPETFFFFAVERCPQEPLTVKSSH